jgi:hypothetical protein
MAVDVNRTLRVALSNLRPEKAPIERRIVVPQSGNPDAASTDREPCPWVDAVEMTVQR